MSDLVFRFRPIAVPIVIGTVQDLRSEDRENRVGTLKRPEPFFNL